LEDFKITEENQHILDILIYSFNNILAEEEILNNDYILPFEVLKTFQNNIPLLYNYFNRKIS